MFCTAFPYIPIGMLLKSQSGSTADAMFEPTNQNEANTGMTKIA